MKNNFTLRWTIANAVGLSLAFLVVQQFLMFYSYGLNFEMYWDFDADKTLSQSGRESLMATGIPIGLTLFGIIFTLAQALILKKFLPKIWPWILNGALGFVIIFLIIWLLRDIWGSIPGPVEPLIIVIGGLIFTIILQWRF